MAHYQRKTRSNQRYRMDFRENDSFLNEFSVKYSNLSEWQLPKWHIRIQGCDTRKPTFVWKFLYSVFVLQCLLLFSSNSEAALLSRLQGPDAKFLQTARSVMSHSGIDFPVAVILDSGETGRPELNRMISYLHAGHSVSVRVHEKAENAVDVGYRAGAYVFFQTQCDVRRFNRTFSALLRDRDWSPLPKALVLVSGDCTAAQLEGVFSALAAADVLRACVVTSGGGAWTYDPLECGPRALSRTQSCARRVPEALLEDTGARNGRRLFPAVVGGLRGARLLAAITPFGGRAWRLPGGGFGGLEADVLRLLAAALNASLRVREPRDGAGFGSRRPDGSYTGLSGEVAAASVDFAANLRYFKPDALHLIGYTQAFSKDDLCVLVAKAGLLPAHLQLVRPFRTSTWAAAGATLLAGGLAWGLLSARHQAVASRRRPRPRPRALSLLEACGPWVGAAVPRPPPRAAPRLFLAAWLPAALVLSTAFQGGMTGSLAAVRWLRDPGRLEEVRGPVYVTASQRAFLSTAPRDALSRLLLTGQLVQDVHQAARRIARDRAGAVLLDRWEAERLARSSEHVSAAGLPRLHVVRRCPYQSYVAYEVPRRSALLPRLDRVLARALEAGIPQHWRASALHAELVRGESVAPVREPPPAPLRPQHLEVAAGLLALGSAAAAAAFLAELAAGAWRVARQRRRRPVLKV